MDLNAGDVIHAVNLENVTTAEELRTSLETVKPGDPIVLQIEREGRMIFLGFEMD